MRAMQIMKLGGTEVLALQNIPIPEPGPGQVVIRAAYAGVNFVDVMARTSGYHVTQLPFTPGDEVAGYIHALGAGVKAFTIGQPVTAFTVGGTYAEYALAQAALTFPLDESEADLVQGAAFPTVTLTAYNLLVSVARLRAGESVLIHTASGGVGLAALQIARHLGASQVFGTVSTADKAKYALGAGYDQVFLLENFVEEVRQATHGRGVDVLLDSRGEPIRSQGYAALAPFGRQIIFGNGGNPQDNPVSPGQLMRDNRGVLGFSITSLTKSQPEIVAATAREALKLLAAGAIHIDVTEIFPLEQAAEAHRRIEGRQHVGKLLLSF